MSGTVSRTFPPDAPAAAASESAPAAPTVVAHGARGTGPADVAVVANSSTPYRTHLHRRIVQEMPEVRLWSLYTHEIGTSPWLDPPPQEIRPVQFGPGEDALAQ